ncbi:hypothetical protein NA57DRAFT_74405 [Rhizodiscina lignyota]|uniref:N-acetyltransferase domain-containing protein n=1 Tax=Rhizodiscina lignyota TaxID=1504668 RepID=A0A9P4IK97_9PEZI|nr:hypothetical protein NA57DRAFT_74405 [Rhizodiscina lignyota]
MEKLAAIEAAQNSILEPMNLHNAIEFDELLRQRIICGWSNSPSTLEAWRAAMDTHTLSMFWVVPPSVSAQPAPQRLLGHISTQKKIEALDGQTVMHIADLFILPEHRHGGLGGAAVRALESWAKVEPYGSPDCKSITLNAISKRYIEDDGEEWRPFYARVCSSLNIEMPEKGTSNEDWYARMGYVKEREDPMYPVTLDGEKILLIAASLRKTLE